ADRTSEPCEHYCLACRAWRRFSRAMHVGSPCCYVRVVTRLDETGTIPTRHRFAILLKRLLAVGGRGKKSQSSLRFRQVSQVSAGCDGGLHILHGNPFERAMRVVFTAKQVRSRQAQFGKTRAIGASPDSMVIGFDSSGREGLSSQLNRAHILAQPISHVAIPFADFAANACSRFGGL